MNGKLRLTTLLTFICLSLFAQEIDVEQLKGMKIRNIGPAGMSGRVTSIDVDLSNPQIIYVGTASGGVWKSQSGGIKWEPIFDKEPVQSIGAVTVNQKNPSEIWVGTGEGNPRNSLNSGKGIFKSIDGGKTWKLMGLENTRLIHRIIVHRDNPDIVYVGALGSAWGSNEERGVFKTTDGGKTWKKVLYINDQTGVADLVVDPSNPNKIIAAMWEFGRKPWVFNSGGEGSGLYISYDAGENWKQITEKDGLPKGELGRIGLAIAPSKPNIVYALVEAKKNALYKSTDGGHKWKMVADKDIGNRPFYYADIYVDPKNENRIWNLWSYVSKSEDGGKTFKTILDYGKRVHPDHHAFWIHPDDPSYLINGNDGGLNISRDGGVNWEFIDNLPLAQFYHINYDMDFPYHVVGGMQDNGSWVGPSSVLKRGGIRNEDWQEVMFGDGFDVVMRRDNNRYGWAMSQGGNVGYFDRVTGQTRNVKPFHPKGEELRFNWNAALAQNPYSDCGIYFGSQYVHKSMDCGQSWEIISPDLTTNDTIKQKESYETGGLTKDVTQAENFTTILCIAPSPVDENTIWAGTDDGNLQLTRDGGKNWTNLASKLPDCPEGSWIPQIEVSLKNAGEAFVVVNNYRRNDWTPYVYHTMDFGNSWTRIVDEKQVSGYALCIVQDPVVPELLFLGTDYGLYFSIDGGKIWNKWTKGFPSVSTSDLKIHPREHDLIIGTFGRAAWILDDIRPLREIAKSKGKILNQPFKVFEPRDAYVTSFRSVDGIRFVADGEFIGQNKRGGAVISIWSKPEKKKKKEGERGKKEDGKKGKKGKKGKEEEKVKKEEEGKMKKEEGAKGEKGKKGEKEKRGKGKNGKGKKKLYITIYDEAGDTVNNYSAKADTSLYRISWGMNGMGVSYPSYRDRKSTDNPPRGRTVLPGRYKIVIKYKNYKDSTFVNIKMDPRSSVTIAQLKAKQEAFDDYFKIVEKATAAFDQLKQAKKTIKLVDSQMVNAPDTLKKDIAKQGKAMQDSISQLMKIFLSPQNQKGIQRNANILNSHLYRASSYIRSSEGAPNQMAQFAIKKAKTETQKALDAVNTFFKNDWPEYQKNAEAAKHSLFKPFEPIKLE
jgi:photosystem II stability/assembly factor-like uncharacterized protein